MAASRSLLPARRDDYAHLTSAQQSHRPQLEAASVIERTGADEPAVAESLDSEASDERSFTGKSGLRTQRQIQRRALTCFMGSSGALGIPDHTGQHSVDASSDERFQQRHRVGISAGAGIVLCVGENDGPTAGNICVMRETCCLRDTNQVERKLMFSLERCAFRARRAACSRDSESRP